MTFCSTGIFAFASASGPAPAVPLSAHPTGWYQGGLAL